MSFSRSKVTYLLKEEGEKVLPLEDIEGWDEFKKQLFEFVKSGDEIIDAYNSENGVTIRREK